MLSMILARILIEKKQIAQFSGVEQLDDALSACIFTV
ncbi:hypothetical protein J2S25_002561 [Mesobacillus stamsii]|uniref:Transposase n=1 Tax=Mesobacillus stamsii TaxID=225347 RepID=A0ABU0FWP1_9BACI|nr:hypothetical protein [Mesobacillus stamsii]